MEALDIIKTKNYNIMRIDQLIHSHRLLGEFLFTDSQCILLYPNNLCRYFSRFFSGRVCHSNIPVASCGKLIANLC